MPDEPQKKPDDIQGILSDLDDILSDLGSAAAPAPAKPPPPAAVEKRPVEPPKTETPPPPPITAAPQAGPKIELSPRAGMPPVPAPAKKAEPPPPKATAPSGAEVPPPPAVEKRPSDAKPPMETPSVPAPVAPAKPPPPAEIPPNTPKDQIRRVAYIHTVSGAEAKAVFAAFLSSAARTISKKPIFLREVLSLEVANSSDPNAVFEKAQQAKVVAVLAVTEGWSQVKLDELSEACSRAGVLFRCVASGDVQKKATAVDVIVDMMLLSGES